MTTTNFGAPISGKTMLKLRASGLPGDTLVENRHGGILHAHGWKYCAYYNYRLPADDPYYAALAQGERWWPNYGRRYAPADATGRVLFRDGTTDTSTNPDLWAWYWENTPNDIIAYERKAVPEVKAERVSDGLVEQIAAALPGVHLLISDGYYQEAARQICAAIATTPPANAGSAA